LPFEWTPGDNIEPPVKTECFVTYDDVNIYVAFRCYDPDPASIRAHFVSRDAINTFIQDDHVALHFDPFNDQRRAFKFCVNALGVQVDGIYSDVDGYEDFSWDAIWNSAGKITEYGYNVEIAIPLNQLRFPNSKKEQTWGFSAQRSYPRNVRHRMSSHMISRNIASVTSQFNKITGFENLSPGKNIEFDPTLTTIRFDEADMNQFPNGSVIAGKVKVEPGITAKWGITPNMVLNATVNPDFSQVEADALQLDINTRYAIFYPEKRPFFLEGAEYFLTPFNVIFSRTVADPVGGVRLTGKIGKGSIGILATQDRINNLIFPSIQGSNSTSLDESVNSAAVRYRYDIGQNSTIGAVYTGRMGDQYYNHLGGFDAFIRLNQTTSLTLQYLHTETAYSDSTIKYFDQKKGVIGGDGMTFTFNHFSRKWGVNIQGISLTDGFRSDYGFTPRVGQLDLSTYAEYHIWGKPNSWFNQINVFSVANFIGDKELSLTDRQLSLGLVYLGPYQTTAQPIISHTKELYNQEMYDLLSGSLTLRMKPVKGLSFGFTAITGDAIDYYNSRLASCNSFSPDVELSLGRHINLNFSHSIEHLSYLDNKVYTANISQGRVIYNINTKTYLLCILQYRSVSRDTSQYAVPVEKLSKSVFTQFLFSFKFNPRTMLYLGYSNNSLGTNSIDLKQTDQTFFMKLGYAFGV
jgi:hypothetical protein